MQSQSKYQILFTGASGSIGQEMPTWACKLDVRLEDTVQEMSTAIKAAKKGPSVLIHLAAKTSVEFCEANPEVAFRINVDGPLKLLMACQAEKIDRYIFLSTAHVYAPPGQDGVLRLDSPLHPKNMYARSKLLAEEVLLSHESLGSTQVSVARAFSVFSEKMRPHYLYPSLVRRAQNRDFSPIPGFHNVRDFMKSENVCNNLLKLANSRSFPKRIHICTGIGRTVGDLAAEVFLNHGLDPAILNAAGGGRPSDVPKIVGNPTPFSENLKSPFPPERRYD